MQLQSISSQSPNVISITQVREDIDILTKALNKFGKVRVLRGQKVLFDAIDPEFEAKKQAKIGRAVENIRRLAKQMAMKYPRKPGEKSLSQILIEERDKMASGSYEL